MYIGLLRPDDSEKGRSTHHVTAPRSSRIRYPAHPGPSKRSSGFTPPAEAFTPVMSGPATARITQALPATKVIILTTFDYEEYVFEGVKAGALGYLLKDTPAPELVRTIERVHAGERFIQPAVASKILFEMKRRRRLRPGRCS